MEPVEKKEDKDLYVIKRLYERCIEVRNFEINQLIQRNNFFMLFQGVLLASVLQAEIQAPLVELIICVTGIFVSIYQMQMASGAKFWQEWWESRVEHFEKMLLRKIEGTGSDAHQLFTTEIDQVQAEINKKNQKGKGITGFLIKRRFSVGRAPIKVAMVLSLAWTLLLCTTIEFSAITVSIPHLGEFISGFPRNVGDN